MDVRVQGNLLGRGSLTPRPVAASPGTNNGQLHFNFFGMNYAKKTILEVKNEIGVKNGGYILGEAVILIMEDNVAEGCLR